MGIGVDRVVVSRAEKLPRNICVKFGRERQSSCMTIIWWVDNNIEATTILKGCTISITVYCLL
jgi:hypothetical protein